MVGEGGITEDMTFGKSSNPRDIVPASRKDPAGERVTGTILPLDFENKTCHVVPICTVSQDITSS